MSKSGLLADGGTEGRVLVDPMADGLDWYNWSTGLKDDTMGAPSIVVPCVACLVFLFFEDE